MAARGVVARRGAARLLLCAAWCPAAGRVRAHPYLVSHPQGPYGYGTRCATPAECARGNRRLAQHIDCAFRAGMLTHLQFAFMCVGGPPQPPQYDPVNCTDAGCVLWFPNCSGEWYRPGGYPGGEGYLDMLRDLTAAHPHWHVGGEIMGGCRGPRGWCDFAAANDMIADPRSIPAIVRAATRAGLRAVVLDEECSAGPGPPGYAAWLLRLAAALRAVGVDLNSWVDDWEMYDAPALARGGLARLGTMATYSTCDTCNATFFADRAARYLASMGAEAPHAAVGCDLCGLSNTSCAARRGGGLCPCLPAADLGGVAAYMAQIPATVRSWWLWGSAFDADRGFAPAQQRAMYAVATGGGALPDARLCPADPPAAPCRPAPATFYRCDAASGACARGGGGHSTLGECAAACRAPTPAPATPAPLTKFKCHPTDGCVASATGVDFLTCVTVCG